MDLSANLHMELPNLDAMLDKFHIKLSSAMLSSKKVIVHMAIDATFPINSPEILYKTL